MRVSEVLGFGRRFQNETAWVFRDEGSLRGGYGSDLGMLRKGLHILSMLCSRLMVAGVAAAAWLRIWCLGLRVAVHPSLSAGKLEKSRALIKFGFVSVSVGFRTQEFCTGWDMYSSKSCATLGPRPQRFCALS